MIELRPSQASATLRAMFPRSGHTWRRCFAVLNGSSRGRVLTDNPDTPGWAVVQEYSDESVLFLSGTFSRELLAELIAQLRQDRLVLIGLEENDPLLELLPGNPDYDGHDIDFDDRNPTIDLAQFIRPPDGLRLERIDANLVSRCAWVPWMAPDAQAALDTGLGYCLLDGETIVAEAFAGPVVDGELEMATITAEGWRGRGLATTVCARTILECERQGYRTWWNTGLTNIASATIARRMGYRAERQYRLLGWYPPKQAPDGATT